MDDMNDNQFIFINSLVDKFYEFMADVYIEYKNMIDITTIATSELSLNENIENKTKLQSFDDYFLFKLFYNYGIKRRMVNEHIALLYYSKNIKGYKPNEPITMLCRHMLLDMRFMRIISLGIPKAVNLDIFCNTYNIDKTNAATNILSDSNIPKFRLYKFPEGTMLTYNPSLKKYNILPITSAIDLDNDNDNENNESYENNVSNDSNKNNEMDIDIELDIDMEIDLNKKQLKSHPIKIQEQLNEEFNNQFVYSTRRVIGTSNFSSMKSFMEMFEENNKLTNTNLNIIPEELIKDKVLVFNIEHPENKMISSHMRNFNTLCAVFQFKNEDISRNEFNNIALSNTELELRESFKNLGKNMVSQIQVPIFNKLLCDMGININFHLPEVIKGFDKKLEDNTIENTLAINISIEQLENIVKIRPKDFQGFIIYGLNGERTKISNEKYKELKALKGSKPIAIEQWNMKNLFYLYWRLLKDNKIEQFIIEFNIDQNSNFKQLFKWFAMLLHRFSLHLFKIYHYSFVKKTINKPDIPFALKPLCGDLHTNYKNNKIPISQSMVEQYVFTQPANKIFWRIFT